MTDLRVDLALLGRSADRLARLQREFRDIDDRADHLARLVGSAELASAVGEFADNWDDNRSRLLTSLDTVGHLLTHSRDSFLALDAGLSGVAPRT
ncbi:hypothetical protein ABZV64_03975 [Streptomyces sp. NPDC004959]|uniref:hypothetical protein n=1 Tax=unclassified Streptomyces TaxID=2593676 RepID=UPI001F1CF258|nr:hypothetical protein [Streptomyces sp. NRRL F-5630]